MPVPAITTVEHSLLSQALGRDKPRGHKDYRNHVTVALDEAIYVTWMSLTERGLAHRGETLTDSLSCFFYVTEEGKQALNEYDAHAS